KVVDGTHWIMDFKTKSADAKKARDVIKFYGMTRICYVGRPSPTGKQLMMYFKVGSGVPNGPFAAEDALPFSNANVQAKQVGGRWTVVDGNHLMINFEASEANCRKAVWLIKKYGFNFICFVGRPNPPMMYFRK